MLVVQAKAHEQLGQQLPREKHKHAYEEALKQRYKHLPEVKRILRHRHLPAAIYRVRCHHRSYMATIALALSFEACPHKGAAAHFGADLALEQDVCCFDACAADAMVPVIASLLSSAASSLLFNLQAV